MRDHDSVMQALLMTGTLKLAWLGFFIVALRPLLRTATPRIGCEEPRGLLFTAIVRFQSETRITAAIE